LAQLKAVAKVFQELCRKSGYDDLSDLEWEELYKVIALARAAVTRVAGPNSEYVRQIEQILQATAPVGHKTRGIAGVVEALALDVENGYLHTYAELLHAELFSDFLEMAEHLLQTGYKDPAAVVAGSTLEGHLHQLCHGVGVHSEDSSGRPIKADKLNADLTKAGSYSKLDQKNVTAWLDLRNKAAHGEYGAYEAAQVAIMISGVRDFIARNPA